MAVSVEDLLKQNNIFYPDILGLAMQEDLQETSSRVMDGITLCIFSYNLTQKR